LPTEPRPSRRGRVARISGRTRVLESRRSGAHSASCSTEFVTDAPTHHLETHGLPGRLMGFRLADDNLHAPNEKHNRTWFCGGTKSCACLQEELAKSA
jgi:hypothetical protein